jgi:putative DNA primase/helicase
MTHPAFKDIEAQLQAPPDVDALGELAGAHLLLEISGGRLRHTTDRGWLWFDDVRWAPAEKRARRMAAKVGKARRKRGNESTRDPKVIEAFYRAAKRDESNAGIEAILKIAAALPGIDADHVEFDADHMALNCLNGTVDLLTGELREHRREDFITKLCPHAYDPAATCPRWLQFLDEVFCDDGKLITWMQWLTGYSFTGSTHRHIFPIPHGDGRNGKGAYFRAIYKVLGADYAAVVDPEDIMLQNNPRNSEGIAQLRGVRFAYAQETEQGRRLNESLIKRLTGGDRLKARHLYGHSFEFDPSHKLWLATNYRPKVTGTAAGIWERLRLIPFTRHFKDDEQDPKLDAKLAAEAPGILAWAVAGARMKEPPVPPRVRIATDEFREESDTLATFIEDSLCEWEHAKVLKRDVYAAYRKYMNNHCEDMKAFNKRLAARGFEEKATNQGAAWEGVALRAERQSEAE